MSGGQAGFNVIGSALDNSITGNVSGAEYLYGWLGNDTLTAVGYHDTLDGGAGDDTLIAAGYYNTLLGGAGNDVLRSSSTDLYHMTYEGGTGNDTITGGYYADYYRFNRGDGADTITDGGSHSLTNASYVDRINFGVGISASDLGARRTGNDLVLSIAGNDGDQITIKHWFAGLNHYHIEQTVFADGTIWSASQLMTLALQTSNLGTAGNDVLAGTWYQAETLFGMEGDDTLTAVGYGDTLDGGAGDDVLSAGDPQNWSTVFVGGEGGDTMHGSYHSDTYVFNRGDGSDTINETSYGYAHTDTLRFGAGIAVADVGARREGNDLVVNVAGQAGDQITIKHWFAGLNHYHIEQTVFADGTIWSASQLMTLALQTSNLGTAGNDVLAGTWYQAETLFGMEGDDTLTAVGYGDTLDGGAGDDVLSAGDPQNWSTVFVGGEGGDTMHGSYHSDTYVFNRGDGSDTINETSYGYAHTDTLRFGAGIAVADVGARREGNDLVVNVAGQAGDQITIKHWFAGLNHYHIEQTVFADGTIWSASQLMTLALQTSNLGTAGNDVLAGTWYQAETLFGMEGDDTLTAVGYGDTLDGGAGDDVLSAGDPQNWSTVFVGGGGWRHDARVVPQRHLCLQPGRWFGHDQ